MKFLRHYRGGRQFAEPHKFVYSLCVHLFVVIDLSYGVLFAQHCENIFDSQLK